MRYIIGVDLGTTNSAVSYVDTEKSPFQLQPFLIPQLVSTGRVESQPTLPSFCYLVAQEEWLPGTLKLPWKEELYTFVGQFAKEQGARVPTRLVQSAKSWLCNVAAHRRDKILPVEVADLSQRMSPVEASAKYLCHLKEAWNATLAKGDPTLEFEEQEIILTVPASFDEVARLLTVEAAYLAGLRHVTLLEEPQAAFYSWIAQHEQQWQQQMRGGESILVCDVGGGTTDFSLIEVQQKEEQLIFQRMAVGDHLLLGGDNMDAALAHLIEQQMQEQGHPPLESIRWQQVVAQARSAKEILLQAGPSSDTYNLVLQATGASVIKGSVTVTLQRDQVRHYLLSGFFGQFDLQEALQRHKSRGIKTMGLPYEDEPSITKHLAHFLEQAHYLNKGVDYLLFNGGAFKPELFQHAIETALQRWFPHKKLTRLASTSLDLAVARGAAYYGKARRGLGISIKSGIPRTYYLEIEMKEASGLLQTRALTLLPRGTDEGTVFEPQQVFFVTPNRPVAFQLLSSHVRLNDQQGELLTIDEQEMQKLPPIHTVLRFGKQSQETLKQEPVPVRLGIQLTTVGTLEMWLQSQKSAHRWNLEFQLRTASGQEHSSELSAARYDETFDKAYLEGAKKTIELLFEGSSSIKPNTIMERLEEQLGAERREWSLSILRGLWEPLHRMASKRKMTNEHEARWWNLAGFFLRPGFGFPLDDHRLKELWRIILGEIKLAKTSECQIQSWICYRRMAGGLSKGQQMQLASEMISTLFTNKTHKIEIKNKSELYLYSEKIRALAAMERLDLNLKIRLGEAILNRILQGNGASYEYWALARLGARHLVYGSIGQVIPKEVVSCWIEKLLSGEGLDSVQLSFVLGQLARKMEQRELNIEDQLINKILEKKLEPHLKKIITQTEYNLTANEQEMILGDRLPIGLWLEG